MGSCTGEEFRIHRFFSGSFEMFASLGSKTVKFGRGRVVGTWDVHLTLVGSKAP